jgi:hypothetical protein
MEVLDAVKHFWRTRLKQRDTDDDGTPEGDNRAAAVGGKQLDAFAKILAARLMEVGVAESAIFDSGRENITLPGYYRPAKQWDVVVISSGKLLAAIELKSLCGPSFGNNYNNRIEEATGSSSDFWQAYRMGLFAGSPPPFLGYLLLLEEAPGSARAVDVAQKHFPVDEEFRDASYATRCQISIRRLVAQQLYTAACLILSPRDEGPHGKYNEPSPGLTFQRFTTGMQQHVKAHLS